MIAGNAFIVAAVTAEVTWIMGHLLSVSVWFGTLVIIVTCALVLAVVFRRRVAQWARSVFPFMLSAVIAFPLALSANAIWQRSGSDRACGEPVDLRVVAAPETVTALRAAAQAYERDRCPAATITVVPEPSITGMEAGFTHGWTESSTSSADTLYGPQPDIWIADSAIVADGVSHYVRQSDSGGEEAHLDVGQPVATSPVVLGMLGGDAAGASEEGIPQDGTSNGTSLAALIADLRKNDVLDGGLDNVLRAVPDTSESALLATPALYNAPPGREDAQIEQNQVELPEKALGAAQAFPDGTALLCFLRKEQDSGAKPPAGTAFLLPEQSVFAYDTGSALGDSCPADTTRQGGATRQDWKLYPYYVSDLPVLDYTFVHVRWAGQDDAGRYRTVEDFQQWLMRNSATAMPGFRDLKGRAGNPFIGSMSYVGADDTESPPTVTRPRFPSYRRCGGDLANIMNDCYDDARGRLLATILLDVSGSMAQETTSGSSRLAWAQQAGEGIARLAHPEDSLSFLPFAQSVRAARPAGPLPQQSLIGDLDDQVASGLDTPLAAEIDDVIGSLHSGRRDLVVFTDGQRAGTNPGYEQAAGKLAADARGHRGLRVFLVLTSGASCSSEPVKTLASALRNAGVGDCVPALGSPAESAAELFARLLGG